MFTRFNRKALLAMPSQSSLKCLNVVLLFLAINPAYATTPTGVHINSIAQVRHLPLGTVVTVDGSVTTPSGVFASSFFDQGFGLQDKTAGIYVSSQSNLAVAPRQKVQVSGTLQDNYGLLILVPTSASDVVSRGVGHPVNPQWYATGSIGEATEGRLVKVVGTITQAPVNDLPYGYKFSVDDGSGTLQIFVNLQTGIDINNYTAGQRVSVTGFSSQFDTHYEIDPRSPSDIAVQMH